MSLFLHQAPEPTEVPRRLSTDAYLPSRQRTVKLLRLLRVAQTALAILARCLVDKRYLLKPRMESHPIIIMLGSFHPQLMVV